MPALSYVTGAAETTLHMLPRAYPRGSNVSEPLSDASSGTTGLGAVERQNVMTMLQDVDREFLRTDSEADAVRAREPASMSNAQKEDDNDEEEQDDDDAE